MRDVSKRQIRATIAEYRDALDQNLHDLQDYILDENLWTTASIVALEIAEFIATIKVLKRLSGEAEKNKEKFSSLQWQPDGLKKIKKLIASAKKSSRKNKKRRKPVQKSRRR